MLIAERCNHQRRAAFIARSTASINQGVCFPRLSLVSITGHWRERPKPPLDQPEYHPFESERDQGPHCYNGKWRSRSSASYIRLQTLQVAGKT